MAAVVGAWESISRKLYDVIFERPVIVDLHVEVTAYAILVRGIHTRIYYRDNTPSSLLVLVLYEYSDKTSTPTPCFSPSLQYHCTYVRITRHARAKTDSTVHRTVVTPTYPGYGVSYIVHKIQKGELPSTHMIRQGLPVHFALGSCFRSVVFNPSSQRGGKSKNLTGFGYHDSMTTSPVHTKHDLDCKHMANFCSPLGCSHNS